MTLVGEVETVLAELLRMTGAEGRGGAAAAAEIASSRGFGPAIPGLTTQAVDGQQDIDDLMAGLGI